MLFDLDVDIIRNGLYLSGILSHSFGLLLVSYILCVCWLTVKHFIPEKVMGSKERGVFFLLPDGACRRLYEVSETMDSITLHHFSRGEVIVSVLSV